MDQFSIVSDVKCERQWSEDRALWVPADQRPWVRCDPVYGHELVAVAEVAAKPGRDRAYNSICFSSLVE